MKILYSSFFAALVTIFTFNVSAQAPPINITAVMDFGISGSSGKALMVTANQNIANLSLYQLGSANNGGGTDGQEYTFPSISVLAGQHIIVCRDSTALSNYFDGCLEQFSGALYPTIIIQDGQFPDGNGNDAYELFNGSAIIDIFGELTFSGGSSNYNLPWVYRDSWAWKNPNASTYISSQTPGIFVSGPNATWTNVFVACVVGDGNNGSQQTATINVTSLPNGGANWRPVKTVANGNWFTGAPATPLTLGVNTLTVNSVAFDRSVKFQFSSDSIAFDALSINSNPVYDGDWTYGGDKFLIILILHKLQIVLSHYL
jgi:hypothetical protein